LTHRLDLSLSEEELLARMRKSTRYEIKRAEKLGVRVEKSQDERMSESFYQLQLETAKRQKFVPFSLTYWQEQFAVFSRDNEVILYTSYLEDELLAQAMIIFYGKEAVYHYGASTMLARKYPGAYLIQWAAIKEAKKRGCQRYNFWGVAPVDNDDHRFAKLSVFKRGFGGEDFAYLKAHDLIIDKIRYKINTMVEKRRRKIRKV
jgi:lipid II:glycine glycyltransferase (peptidoglycan interpeptide bridge formation enzyme)